MQTLSPTISPTISRKPKVNDLDEFLPAIAQSTVLRNALSGLDASLNDELDRYRHWKENGQTISYLNPFRPRAVSTQSIWSSPSISDALSPLTPVTGEASEGDRPAIQMPVMPSLNLDQAELHRYQGIANLSGLNPFDSPVHSPEQENLEGLHQGIAQGSDHSFAYVPEPQLNVPLPNLNNGTGESPIKSGFAADDDDEILQRFANDYAENYYQVPAPELTNHGQPRSAIHSLMNPVGIISLLLLLCSSAAIGYLMVDPSGIMKLLKPEASPKSSSKVGEELGKDGKQQAANSNPQSFIPFAEDNPQSNSSRVDNVTGKPANKSAIASKSPLTNPLGNTANAASPNPLGNTSDLFAPSSTFVPSQTLRTVPPTALPPISVAPLPPSNSEPVERSYSSPSRNSEPAPRSTPVPQRAATPSRSVSSPPARPPVTVTPQAAPVRSAEISSPPAPRSNVSVKYAAPLSSASNSSGSYRIVVENSYAASAQQVERDAFVRPSDGQVQMGSFRDQSMAQQRIEELRRQGIPARIE